MKRSLVLIVGGALIVLLVGGFVLLKAIPKKTTKLPPPIEISKVDKTKLDSITLEHGGEVINLTRHGDVWSVKYPFDVKWDTTSINNIVGSFSSLMAQRIIDKSATDLAQYGLQPPQGKADAVLSDGSKIDLLVGNKTVDGQNYYMMKAGSPVVYTVASYNAEAFMSTLDSLRDRTLPSIDTKSLEYVKIVTGGTTIELKTIPKGDPMSFIAFSNMVMVRPFPVARAVDTEALGTMVQNYPSYFQIQKFISDDPRGLAQYGLAPPVSEYELRDSKGGSIHLLVGKTLADGTIYAKLADEPTVFTVNESDIDPILKATPFQLEDKFLLIPNIDNVDSFTIQAPSATYVAKIVRTVDQSAKPDESGKKPTKTTYFLNDKSIQESKFKDYYQSVIGVLADSPNPNPRIAFRPEVTITFELNKGNRTYREYFVPYNRDFYAVFRDGYSDVLLSKGQLDAALQSAANLLK